jgi:hypothetical protein
VSGPRVVSGGASRRDGPDATWAIVGDPSANREAEATLTHVGSSCRHSRRCLRQSIQAAIGIRSARMIGSRPRWVGGRNNSVSWMSGAKWSRLTDSAR